MIQLKMFNNLSFYQIIWFMSDCFNYSNECSHRNSSRKYVAFNKSEEYEQMEIEGLTF